MPTRREVLKGGLGVFALGVGGSALGAHSAIRSIVGPLAQRSGTASPLGAAMLEQLKASRPLGARSFDPKARMIDGFAFKSWFEGDDFEEEIPFHSMPHDFPNGEPPEPTEEIDVVVIGGGLSGLASAYELREYNPVVFELHDVFGGNAQGGRMHGAPFSLGSAYFITPDPGGELDRFYAELGLHEVIRADELASPVEIEGEINPDIWSGLGVPKEDIPAYEAYRKLVIRMTDKYPDVPFDQGWMLELDKLSLREHIEQEMGMPVPAALAAAIQAYCYSSFTAGWEEISAMLGWNFLAAEEFGRWVLPGGNAWIADKLWEKLYPLDRTDPDHAPHLRPNRHVVDTRQVQDGRWQVTWKEPDGIVVVDYDWCIGCRYCQAACPYYGRRFNWGKPEIPRDEITVRQHYLGNRIRPKGKMEKCTFCIQRTRKGRLPACVEACPTGARVFGNLLDPESEIRYVLKHKKVFRMKEELGTDPKFWYFID
jgi:Fe-S-cluster-containing hydrogenase component 2